MSPMLLLAVTALLAGPFGLEAEAQSLDELRGSAQKVLDAHCARCHQEGKLAAGRKEPADGFGNILDIPGLIRDRKHVQPGNPENSELWKLMLSRRMPYDVFTGEDILASSPSAQEIQTIADWIKAEGDAKLAVVFVEDEAIFAAIADDLGKLPDHRVKGTRYLMLTHLHNGGVAPDILEVYRQAAVKLLNSLNYQGDAVHYEKLGPQDLILRFNLADMGWTDEQWNLLLAANPFAIDYSQNDRVGQIKTMTGSPAAFMRADVFAFAATQPDMYHQLMKIPGTVAALEKMLEVDSAKNIADRNIARAGFQKSGVSRHNRLIERHAFQWGSYWKSYDFSGNQGRQSLFLHPTGPDGDNGFKHDGGEFIFSLPNGMQAYMLAKADGSILRKGPPEIVLDPRRPDKAVANGLSCMGCHVKGIIDTGKDDIRSAVLADRNFPREVRDLIEATHPERAKMDELFAQDSQRFTDAMRRAGLDPSLFYPGSVEMILSLVEQFERNLTRQMAAAEFGLNEEAFAESISQVGGDAFGLGRRLDQDQVPRDQFAGLFAMLLAKLTDNSPLKVTLPPASAAEAAVTAAVDAANAPPPPGLLEFDLALFSDKPTYTLKEKAVLTVKPQVDCFLTMEAVDQAGKRTMLVPNRFNPKAPRLKGGESVTFPGSKDRFVFGFLTPGKEKITATCNTEKEQIPGIDYDFSKGPYVPQGDDKTRNAVIAETKDAIVREMVVDLVSAEETRKEKEAKKSITLTVNQ